ncbi:MAG: hypothetical protein Q7S44_03500 [bacterium]|nr:hypothetical protein [bacterium]
MKKKLFLGLLILLAVVFLAISRFNLLSVTSVEIQGSLSCAPQNDIISFLNLKGVNIFVINEEELRKKAAQKFPCLQTLQLERKLPRIIVAVVREKEPSVNVTSYVLSEGLTIDLNSPLSSQASLLDWSFSASSSDVWLADKGGKIFKQETRADLPTLFINEQTIKLGQNLNQGLFESLTLALDKFKKINLPVTQLKVLGSVLLTNTQPRVVLSLAKDMSRQLASLQLILQKAKIDGKAMDTIDLRFDKPVVVYSQKHE